MGKMRDVPVEILVKIKLLVALPPPPWEIFFQGSCTDPVPFLKKDSNKNEITTKLLPYIINVILFNIAMKAL